MIISAENVFKKNLFAYNKHYLWSTSYIEFLEYDGFENSSFLIAPEN